VKGNTVKNMNENIAVETLPLLEIVSKYTISGDKILFKRPDVDILRNYCFENDIVFERIEGFRFKGQDLYPEIDLIFNNYNPEKSISSYDSDVRQFLGYKTDGIYFECKLVKCIIDDPFEYIDLDDLPVHEIVSMYVVRLNMILLNLYNMHLLVDYCHKNEIFFLSIDNFSFHGEYIMARDMFVGWGVTKKNSKNDTDITTHIEIINRYLDNTTGIIDEHFGDTEVPDVYFEIMLKKHKETTLLK